MLTSVEDTRPNPDGTFAVERVSKRYGSTQALASVSLSFPAGQVTALLGENGAGKSTLLNILAGATRPTRGSLLCGGQRLVLRDPGDARANGIAIIPQVPEVVESLSVAENILLSRLPNGLAFSRAQARLRAGELIERWGLQDFLDPRATAGRLSAAGRQLVEILRATYAQPRLVAFDEPTSALGPYEVERLRAVVRRMRDEGVAVVYVSHRWAEIQALSSRIAVLRDGRLVQVHETGDVPLLDVLVEMGGRAAAERFERTGAIQDAPPRLELRDVSTAKLHHVSMSLRPGEIVGVAGLEGSGRSELARVIVGDVPALTGSVEVDGRSLPARHRRSPLRSRIGYTPEDRHAEGLLPERSVQANVVLASLPRLNRWGWVDRRRERTLARDLRSRLDIRCSSVNSSVASLSGGNQQKVVVARSLAVDPVVWVLDDPSKGIDISTKQALYAFLDEYAASGRATLLISSEITELLTISDRILVMHLGRMVADFPAGSVTEHQVMEAMFGHRSTPGGTDAESAGPQTRQGVTDHVN